MDHNVLPGTKPVHNDLSGSEQKNSFNHPSRTGSPFIFIKIITCRSGSSLVLYLYRGLNMLFAYSLPDGTDRAKHISKRCYREVQMKKATDSHGMEQPIHSGCGSVSKIYFYTREACYE